MVFNPTGVDVLAVDILELGMDYTDAAMIAGYSWTGLSRILKRLVIPVSRLINALYGPYWKLQADDHCRRMLRVQEAFKEGVSSATGNQLTDC
ncbi:hypothetical protein GOP47_0015706 [Adiantum capillus-veneris]|uniref:Uncharacterized protein n=1 Tax=Adiantum capillus-veneris TaxID=13818 RepID=A0A9D4UK83_ADICA|nr:hypothetical protein GOP47_0015706 [Adiantum capillus-veneris]